MSAFVLVHGSWHGGWCWRRVASLLRAAGSAVYTPTLTGLGERAHLATPEVGLETHIQDVVNVILYEDLADVILVGHSYATQVVTGVTDRVPDRIGRLVLLDGSFPENGKALLDLIPQDRREHFLTNVRAGDGWRMPSLAPAEWGVTDPADLAWMTPKLVAHPLKAVLDPLVLTGAGDLVPRTYITCTGRARNAILLDQIAAARSQGWRIHEIATGHDAMITRPRELADLLLEE